MTGGSKFWAGIIFAVVLVIICVAAAMSLQNDNNDDNTKPILSIVDSIPGDSECKEITLIVENTDFVRTISVNDVKLSAALSALDLISVQYIGPNTVKLHTNGFAYRSISEMAVVTVSADATESKMELTASRALF